MARRRGRRQGAHSREYRRCALSQFADEGGFRAQRFQNERNRHRQTRTLLFVGRPGPQRHGANRLARAGGGAVSLPSCRAARQGRACGRGEGSHPGRAAGRPRHLAQGDLAACSGSDPHRDREGLREDAARSDRKASGGVAGSLTLSRLSPLSRGRTEQALEQSVTSVPAP